MRQFLKKLTAAGLIPTFFLFQFPASTNYQLNSYEFGGGGGMENSSNYSLEGIIGEAGGDQASTNYKNLAGLTFIQNANVPTVTLVNSASWYNKLLVTVVIQNNPTDAKFAIAITDDNWTTTKYVQSDNTVGAALGTEDYQTYANWGSGSGENIIGLTANTTYKVKVKATRGIYTESPYGPEASATTSAVTLSFDIDIGTDSSASTDPPYSVDFGTLTVSSVNTATNKVWVDLATNAEYGGFIYVYGTNNGLRSSDTNYTITSGTANLSSASEGYGLQSANSSGLASVSPFNSGSESVGVVDTTIREILNSANIPVSGGRGSITIKAKTTSTTPASNDYTDTLTLIASGTF